MITKINLYKSLNKTSAISVLCLILSINLLLSQATPNNKLHAKTLLENSFELIKNNHLNKAEEQLALCESYLTSKSNDSLKVLLKSTYGFLHLELQNLTTAQNYFNDAIYLSKTKANNYILLKLYNNLATIYESKKDTLTAISFYKKALKYQKKENRQDYTNSYWPKFNLAYLDFYYSKFPSHKQDKLEKLIDYYPKDGTGQHKMYIESCLTIANIEAKKKNFNKALVFLKKSDSLSKKPINYLYLIKSEKLKQKIYKNTSNDSLMCLAMQKQIEYLEERNIKKEAELKQNDKLQRKIFKKDYKIKVQENKIFEYKIFIGSIALLLFIVLIAIFLLYRAKEQTEYASKLKENFFSTISHELRTPLFSVLGLTDILIDQEHSEKQKTHLKTLKTTGSHLLSIINNILHINKYNVDKIKLNISVFNFKEVIEHIVSSVNYMKKENNNIIATDVDKNIPLNIKGDFLKLSQVLINLMNNALKFTKNGKVRLKATITSQSIKNIKIKFEVIDNGIGIQKEKQEKIFKDFYQESMALDRNYEGTGLGLSIVRRLLSSMDSEINLISEKGKGSNFWFSVNLQLPEENFIKSNQENQLETDFKNKHILVVDDNKVNLMITQTMLEKHKAKVTVLDNGFDAIELLKTKSFYMLLMDIHMPSMNGYETTKQIKMFDKKTPIIAFTALNFDDINNEVLNSGMLGVLTKPFTMERFYDVIKEIQNKLN